MQIVFFNSLQEMSKPVLGKIKKSIINLSSAESAQRVVKVKTFYLEMQYLEAG